VRFPDLGNGPFIVVVESAIQDDAPMFELHLLGVHHVFPALEKAGSFVEAGDVVVEAVQYRRHYFQHEWLG
jgi:hypothetical protein